MSKPWADQPFSLLTIPGQPGALSYSNIAVMSVATEMANVHNALLRGLNSIYLQAPHVTHAADIADLLFYTKAWTETVNHHHELEETIFFPRVHELAKEAGEVEGMMTRNVEQHHTFEPKMVEMAEWVEEVKQGRKEYDSKALLGLIDSFGPVLMEHLHDEIGTLIGLQKCNGEEIKRAMESVVKAGQNSVDPYVVIPQFLGCIDKGYPGSANFPPILAVLKWLNAYWFARRHQGAWRFNPCDHWGRQRPLQFV